MKHTHTLIHTNSDPSIATTPKSDLKIDFDKPKTDTSNSANYIKATNSIKPNIIKHKVHENTLTTTVGMIVDNNKKPTLTTVSVIFIFW